MLPCRVTRAGRPRGCGRRSRHPRGGAEPPPGGGDSTGWRWHHRARCHQRGGRGTTYPGQRTPRHATPLGSALRRGRRTTTTRGPRPVGRSRDGTARRPGARARREPRVGRSLVGPHPTTATRCYLSLQPARYREGRRHGRRHGRRPGLLAGRCPGLLAGLIAGLIAGPIAGRRPCVRPGPRHPPTHRSAQRADHPPDHPPDPLPAAGPPAGRAHPGQRPGPRRPAPDRHAVPPAAVE